MSRRPLSSAPHAPGRHGWMIEGVSYLYRRVPQSEMFGFSDIWLDTETRVPMFDRERTVADAFLHPRSEGAGHLGAVLIEERGSDLDLDRLLTYAEATGSARVAARVAEAIHAAKTGLDDADV